MKKICMIGNGVHAKQNIIPSIRELNISLDAIASEYLQNETEFIGIKCYSDYKEMLEKEKPNIVLVCKTAENQFRIAKDCLNFGIEKLFVEKPMGLNSREAKELEELAQRKNCQVMVGFMKKFSPCYLKMKEIINCHEFGKVKQFNAEFYITSGRVGWDNEVFLKKGGIHFINLLVWFFGEAVDVKSFTSSIC